MSCSAVVAPLGPGVSDERGAAGDGAVLGALKGSRDPALALPLLLLGGSCPALHPGDPRSSEQCCWSPHPGMRCLCIPRLEVFSMRKQRWESVI